MERLIDVLASYLGAQDEFRQRAKEIFALILQYHGVRAPHRQHGQSGEHLALSTEQLWCACAIFFAKHTPPFQHSLPKINVSSILESTGQRAHDFFREAEYLLPQLSKDAEAKYGQEMQVPLSSQKHLYVTLAVLQHKYKQLHGKLLSDQSDGTIALGWLTFCVAKLKAIGNFADLYESVHLMLAVLASLLEHSVPGIFPKPRDDPVWRDFYDENGCVKTMPCICAQVGAKINDATSFKGCVDKLAKHLESKRHAHECYEELRHLYHEEAERQGVEIDHISILEVSSSQNPRFPAGVSNSPQRFGNTRSWTWNSPSAANGVCSPVSDSMEASSWIAHIVDAFRDAPSKEVEGYIEMADADSIRQQMDKAVNSMHEIFQKTMDEGTSHDSLPEYMDTDDMNPELRQNLFDGNSVFSSRIDRRCSECRKIFYYLQHRLILSEEERLSAAGSAKVNEHLGRLLNQEQFHKVVIAVAMELICAAYKIPSLSFPTIPQRLGIKAFDLTKILEPLVRSETNMPKLLKRHLSSIQERITEILAWEPRSSLFDILTRAVGNSEALPESFSGHDDHGVEERDTAAYNTVQMFLQDKVLRLAAVRCRDFCERLQLGYLVHSKVVGLLCHLVYNRTSLLFNRHLDQILLCSLYGICKCLQRGVKFSTLADHYVKLNPSSAATILRSVVIYQDLTRELRVRERGHIIRFYNQVFVPAVKDELLALSEQKDGESDSMSFDSCHHDARMSPCRKVTHRDNVYVSPMRSSKVHDLVGDSPPCTRLVGSTLGANDAVAFLSLMVSLVNPFVELVNRPRQEKRRCSKVFEGRRDKIITVRSLREKSKEPANPSQSLGVSPSAVAPFKPLSHFSSFPPSSL